MRIAEHDVCPGEEQGKHARSPGEMGDDENDMEKQRRLEEVCEMTRMRPQVIGLLATAEQAIKARVDGARARRFDAQAGKADSRPGGKQEHCQCRVKNT